MKLKLGFPIDPKNFNPMKLTLNGKKIIDMDKTIGTVNPMEILETLSSISEKESSRGDKINALKTIYGKVSPV